MRYAVIEEIRTSQQRGLGKRPAAQTRLRRRTAASSQAPVPNDCIAEGSRACTAREGKTVSQKTRTEAEQEPKKAGWPIDDQLLDSFLDHFFHPRTAILPWEAGEKYERLRSQLVSEVKPADRLEAVLVEQIAVLMWRLRRSYGIETGLLVGHYLVLTGLAVEEESPELNTGYDLMDIARGEQTKPSLSDQATAFALGGDGDPLARLQRYQKGLEDRLYRAIRELHQLQARRRAWARRNVRSRSGPGGAGAQHVVGQTKGNLQPKQ